MHVNGIAHNDFLSLFLFFFCNLLYIPKYLCFRIILHPEKLAANITRITNSALLGLYNSGVILGNTIHISAKILKHSLMGHHGV